MCSRSPTCSSGALPKRASRAFLPVVDPLDSHTSLTHADAPNLPNSCVPSPIATSHVRTASGAAWKEGNIDFTGTLMVFTLKLVATALDFSDGAKPVGDGHPPLTPHQQACRLARLPSVLEFLGSGGCNPAVNQRFDRP